MGRQAKIKAGLIPRRPKNNQLSLSGSSSVMLPDLGHTLERQNYTQPFTIRLFNESNIGKDRELNYCLMFQTALCLFSSFEGEPPPAIGYSCLATVILNTASQLEALKIHEQIKAGASFVVQVATEKRYWTQGKGYYPKELVVPLRLITILP